MTQVLTEILEEWKCLEEECQKLQVRNEWGVSYVIIFSKQVLL